MHLLIFPISALVVLIYLGFVLKFGLWSFMVMNGSFFAVVSILSSNPDFRLFLNVSYYVIVNFLIRFSYVFI